MLTGALLGAAFFPMLFNKWFPRDDEGVFQYGLRSFLAGHGHLYSTIWSDLYGPFYYLFMSTVYRVTRQQPTPENARWIVLVLTVATCAFLGAAVWRVTKSVPASVLTEVAAFMLLITFAGNEPLHPGSLEVFLVSIVAFELASYSATQRTLHLVGIGVATGALLMTKVNAGGLAAVAIAFGFVVGSRHVPRWMQIVVAVVVALVPLALVSQRISEAWAQTFAAVVIGAIVGMFMLASIDPLPTPRWSLVPVATGAAGAVACSLAFPLLTGTGLSDVIDGVLVRPLKFSSGFSIPANVTVDWFTLMITIVGLGVAVAFRSWSKESIAAQSAWTHAVLAVVALWILNLGVVTLVGWLPVLVVLPALAYCCNSSESVRLALRLTVLFATLQVLVIYPVAGSQIGWGTAAMVVPCGIAVGVGIESSRAWRELGVLLRAGAAAFVCLALIAANHNSPVATWRAYVNSPALGVPGTGLMRVDPGTAATVQEVARQLRVHCDTFYGVPDLNSFYVFSELPGVTTMVANGGPAGLTADQQLQVAHGLDGAAAVEHQRVCILRDGSVPSLVPGPLTDVLNGYGKVVATVGGYTIARHN